MFNFYTHLTRRKDAQSAQANRLYTMLYWYSRQGVDSSFAHRGNMPASLSTNSSPACVAALCSGVKQVCG